MAKWPIRIIRLDAQAVAVEGGLNGSGAARASAWLGAAE
jgi:hypothetical protein